MVKLRTKTFARLDHVGTLNAADKRRDSYEGSGLSVSRHPEEWREIARGIVSGDTWSGTRIDRKPGRFVDVHALSHKQKAAIAEWGVTEGLATKCELHGFSYEDDELEETVSCVFLTEEERDREVDGNDEAALFTQSGLQATDALRAISAGECPPGTVEDMVLLAYVERETDLDGCWWDDHLDVLCLSAPRGVIVPSRVALWTFEKRD